MYVNKLETTLGPERELIRKIIMRAQQDPKRIVLPEGNLPVIIRAAYHTLRDGIAKPILLGSVEEISAIAKSLQIPLNGIEIIDPERNPYLELFADKLFLLRQRRGWSMEEVQRQLLNPYVFGAMLVREGLVDGQVHGVADSYPNAILPVLQVIDRRPGVTKVSGLYLMISKNRTLLFADATVNIQPNAEDLAEIAILTGEMAHFFDMEPRLAMLSFSNFGSVQHPEADKVTAAMQIVRHRRPNLLIEGEMQADTAVVESILNERFPFNHLGQPANVLIFPDLTSGNVSYKLLDHLGGAKAIGPLLMGLSRPFNVVQRNSDMENVSTIIAFTVAQAQNQKNLKSMER